MFFYLFSSLIVLSALGVVFSQNPVRSVLWLIFAFINSSGLFILLDAEFIAMINIIVYVGAIAVLFLFVVMMIDVSDTQQSFSKQDLLVGAFMCIGMIFNICVIAKYGFGDCDVTKHVVLPQKLFKGLSNTKMIGQVLYDNFLIPFQVMGVMLLVAILGSVSLTQKQCQLNKKPKKILIKDSIKLVNIQPGSKVLDIIYD